MTNTYPESKESEKRPPKADFIFFLPVWNEAPILERSVELLHTHLNSLEMLREKVWKIVVLDNGSTDDTTKRGPNLTAKFGEHVIYNSLPVKGRGNALREGVRHYDAAYYAYLDIDIPIELDGLDRMIDVVSAGKCDVAITKRSGKRPLVRRLLTLGLKNLNRLLFNFDFADVQGGVKVFNASATELFKNKCKENGYYLDAEFVTHAVEEKLNIEEIPVRWIEERYVERRSKIRPIRDGLKALQSIKCIASRTYPAFIENGIRFAIATAVTVGVLFVSMQWVSQPDFSIATQAPNNIVGYTSISIMFSFAYLLVWVLIAPLFESKFPWRLFLVFTGVAFFLVVGATLYGAPVESQDIYWSLLLVKGWIETGANPYLSSPDSLRESGMGGWNDFVKDWRKDSMHLGPLWTLFVVPFSLFSSLPLSLAVMRIVYALILVAGGAVFWKILATYQFSEHKRTFLMMVLIFNPILFRNALIDLHSDALLMVLILFAFYFLRQKKYFGSLLFLVLGVAIKYVSIVLFPVPLVFLLREHGFLKTVRVLSLVGCVVAAIWGVAFFLFGKAVILPQGLVLSSLIVAQYQFSMLGSILIMKWLSLKDGLSNIFLTIKVLGIGVATFLSFVFAYFKKEKEAFVWPYVIMFFFATPWFWPWYFLWILPFFAISKKPEILVILSCLAALIPAASTTVEISFMLVLVSGLFWARRFEPPFGKFFVV